MQFSIPIPVPRIQKAIPAHPCSKVKGLKLTWLPARQDGLVKVCLSFLYLQCPISAWFYMHEHFQNLLPQSVIGEVVGGDSNRQTNLLTTIQPTTANNQTKIQQPATKILQIRHQYAFANIIVQIFNEMLSSDFEYAGSPKCRLSRYFKCGFSYLYRKI